MAFDGTKPANNSAALTADLRANLQDLDERLKSLGEVTATVGNVGTGEDILASHTLPAAKLAALGDRVKGIFWGKYVNNANAKTLRVRVIEGANNTVLLAVTLTVSEAGHWLLGFVAMRTGATTFRGAAQVVGGPGNGITTRSSANVTSSSTATWANAVELRITGEATGNDDITVEGGFFAYGGA